MSDIRHEIRQIKQYRLIEQIKNDINIKMFYNIDEFIEKKYPGTKIKIEYNDAGFDYKLTVITIDINFI